MPDIVAGEDGVKHRVSLLSVVVSSLGHNFFSAREATSKGVATVMESGHQMALHEMVTLVLLRVIRARAFQLSMSCHQMTTSATKPRKSDSEDTASIGKV